MMALDRMLAMVEESNKEKEREEMNEEEKEMIVNKEQSVEGPLLNAFDFKRQQFSLERMDRRDFKTWQKVEFAKLIRLHKNVLFGECDGLLITSKSKEEAWKKIAQDLEGMGADSYKGKTWMRLRDHDWQYIRRHALSRYESGTTKFQTGRLSELDEVVIEIVQPDKSTTSNNNLTTQLNMHSSSSSSTSFDQQIQSQLCSLIAASSTADSPNSSGGGGGGMTSFLEKEIKAEPFAFQLSASGLSSPAPVEGITVPNGSINNGLTAREGTPAKHNEPLTSTRGIVLPSNCTMSVTSNKVNLSSTKRRRVDTSEGERSASSPDLQRQRLELEIEHLVAEEERRKELHQLEIERRRLINQCIQLRLLREGSENGGDLGSLQQFLKSLC